MADHDDLRSTTAIPVGLMRSRRTAAAARAAMGAIAIVFAMSDLPHVSLPQLLAAAGFAVIFATGVVQLISPRIDWLRIEESLAPVSAVLIVGLGPERVTTLSLLWLGAVASGVLARGAGSTGRAERCCSSRSRCRWRAPGRST